MQTALIYTDAFFQMGQKVIKIRDAWDHDWQGQGPLQSSKNGWGFIVIPDQSKPETALAFHGIVPKAIVQLFSGTKAFIYFLEIVAAIMAPLMLAMILPDHYIAFIDNEAAKYAILKGYGKRARINRLIGAFWTFHAKAKLSQWTERVSSKANWADSVSRGDWSLAKQKGWIRIHAQLQSVWPILKQIAVDPEYSQGSGPFELASALQDAVRPQLVSRGFKVRNRLS